jgi:cytosine/adenosine deaminase-related metal-dependent hydrolase
MPRNLIHSDTIADYRGVIASPGAVLLDGNYIEAVGTPEEIGQPSDVVITQINGLLTPSLVNAHAHLDLSGEGIAPEPDSFISWVEEVVFPIRAKGEVISAVNHGATLSKVGGSVIVGDIAGTVQAAQCTKKLLPNSVPFVELFGAGDYQQVVIDRLNTIEHAFGLQPHALYSCGAEVYKASFESGRQIATHLSETIEELEYAEQGTGPLLELVKKLGVWDDTVEIWNDHPVEAILKIAKGAHFVSAHLNYIQDKHIELLANSNMSVAYCPRASAYFGHVNHRWKEMVDAGVNVALGTDSLLCLDTPDRISVLDEMRFLYNRENADPTLLFRMATINGAVALGLDPSLVCLQKGETAGLLSFEGCQTIESILQPNVVPAWACIDSTENG